MNENDQYQSWVEKRRSVVFPDDFSKKIVGQILRSEHATRQPKPKWELGRWIEWISLRPHIQTAMIAIAFLAGALRFFLILQMVFSF
jgi:hypothetical protein